jgi:hypothetical protein
MANQLARSDDGAAVLEQVVISGDLTKLTAQQRVQYYGKVCESVGLNPFTKPFDYIQLNGKLTLYAKKDATDQLRAVKRVSLRIVNRERIEDVYVVTAQATMPDGRIDESTGAVNLGALKGENLANALMKAETKAKRRVTLSICGLGWLDETEVQSISGATPVHVDTSTGEILDAAPVQHPLRAQPPTPRVLTRPAEQKPLDRQAAIKKIKLMWLSEEAKGYDLTEQAKEKDIPIEDDAVFSDQELIALGTKIKDRLQEAQANAEIFEPEAVEA